MKVGFNFSNLLPASLFVILSLFINLTCSLGSAYAIPVSELELNDENATTNPLSWGHSGRGTIASGAEYDGWILQSIRSGDLLFALLSSTADNGDPVLSGYYTKSIDDTANADIYNDDGGPPSNAFRDSLFAGEPMRRTGALFLRVDGFGSSTLDPYELFQTVVGPHEILPETEPNDTPDTAMPVNSPAILAQGGDELDYFSFYARFGQRIVVMVDQNPRRPNPATPFVSQIAVFDSDGTTDITNSGGTYNCNTPGCASSAVGALPAPHDGTYYVRVTKAPPEGSNPPNPDGDYHLAVLVEGSTPLVGACCNGTSCGLESEPNCRGHFSGARTTCLGDNDGDGIPDDCDNCSSVGNLSQEDDDGDDVGNSCDVCSSDPLKVAPGACGCGVVDVDANGNGTADCLPGPELKSLVASAVSSLKKLQDLPGGASSSERKAKSTRIKAIKTLLAQIQAIVQSSGAVISVNKPGFNLTLETDKFRSLVSKALKSAGSALASNKKKASAQGSKIVRAISA